MTGDDFTVPDDLSELLGPAQRDHTAAPTDHSPVPAATAFAGHPDLTGTAGGSSRAQLAAGRKLFGRRLSPEQRTLRHQARGEEQVAKVLDRMARVGSRVLHDRRTPNGFGQIDHVLISPAGIHLIEALTVSVRTPMSLVNGSVRLGSVPIDQRLIRLRDTAQEVADAAAAIITRAGMPVKVFATTAVVWEAPGKGFTRHDVDVVSLRAVPAWVTSRPSLYDATAVAALTEAVAVVCPPYQLHR